MKKTVSKSAKPLHKTHPKWNAPLKVQSATSPVDTMIANLRKYNSNMKVLDTSFELPGKNKLSK